MPPPPKTNLDGLQVLTHSFDQSTGEIRVKANISASAAPVEVIITHLDDSIRLGDGTNFITSTTVGPKVGVDVNLIGSTNPIDVNIVSSSIPKQIRNIYAEITSIASATETTIVSYTVPGGKTAYLLEVEASGTNIAMYKVFKNASVIAKQYTYFGNSLTGIFDFKCGDSLEPGLELVAGDVITIKVTHSRPMVGDFDARIEVIEFN